MKTMKTSKRGRLFAGASVLTAAGAIGIGALVSSGAMAATSDGEADDTVSVTMGQVGVDGEGFSCSFTEAELPEISVEEFDRALTPEEAEAGVVIGDDGQVAQGDAVGGGGPAVAGGGVVEFAEPLPVGEMATGDAEIVEFDEPISLEDAAELAPIEGVLDLGEMREGTEEECSGLLEALDDPTAPTVASGPTTEP